MATRFTRRGPPASASANSSDVIDCVAGASEDAEAIPGEKSGVEGSKKILGARGVDGTLPGKKVSRRKEKRETKKKEKYLLFISEQVDLLVLHEVPNLFLLQLEDLLLVLSICVSTASSLENNLERFKRQSSCGDLNRYNGWNSDASFKDFVAGR